MIRLTPDWTKAHRVILPLLITLVIGAGVSAHTEDRSTAVAVITLLLMTAVAALAVEPSIGASIGIGGAALIVLVKRTTGSWDSEQFLPTAVQVLSCIVLGLIAGPVGSRLSREVDQYAGPSGAGQAVGSLGLLGAGLGELRLEEEIERARFFDRPVSILRFRASLRPTSDGDEERATLLFRSVGRQIESMVRLTDIPFSYDQNDIVVILPETDGEAALSVARRVRSALVASSFGVRPFGHRIRLSDHVEIRVGFACSNTAGTDSLELLTAMLTLVEEWPVEDADDPEEWIGSLAGHANEAKYAWHPAVAANAVDVQGESAGEHARRRENDHPPALEIEPIRLPSVSVDPPTETADGAGLAVEQPVAIVGDLDTETTNAHQVGETGETSGVSILELPSDGTGQSVPFVEYPLESADHSAPIVLPAEEEPAVAVLESDLLAVASERFDDEPVAATSEVINTAIAAESVESELVDGVGQSIASGIEPELVEGEREDAVGESTDSAIAHEPVKGELKVGDEESIESAIEPELVEGELGDGDEESIETAIEPELVEGELEDGVGESIETAISPVSFEDERRDAIEESTESAVAMEPESAESEDAFVDPAQGVSAAEPASFEPPAQKLDPRLDRSVESFGAIDVDAVLDGLLRTIVKTNDVHIESFSVEPAESQIRTGFASGPINLEIFSVESDAGEATTSGEPVLFEYVHLKPASMPELVADPEESKVLATPEAQWSVALLLAARALVEQANEALNVARDDDGQSMPREIASVIDDMIDSLAELESTEQTTQSSSDPLRPGSPAKRRG